MTPTGTVDTTVLAQILGAAGGGNPYIAAGSMALGLANTISGFTGLRKTSRRPAPRYKEDPAMAASRSRAEMLAQSGFTSAEKQAYQDMASRRYATQNQMIKDTAGGLGSFASRAIGALKVSDDIAFAARDAALKRENIRYADTFAKNLQRINDANTQVAIQERNQALQSYGMAAQSGLSQLASGLNAFGASGGFDGLFKKKGDVPAGATPAGRQTVNGPAPDAMLNDYYTNTPGLNGMGPVAAPQAQVGPRAEQVNLPQFTTNPNYGYVDANGVPQSNLPSMIASGQGGGYNAVWDLYNTFGPRQ